MYVQLAKELSALVFLPIPFSPSYLGLSFFLSSPGVALTTTTTTRALRNETNESRIIADLLLSFFLSLLNSPTSYKSQQCLEEEKQPGV